MPGGASGHETDKITSNSPAGTVLLAKGLNPDDGGAEMVHHDTASGGAVFSVGSIIWPASLMVDDGVSQITPERPDAVPRAEVNERRSRGGGSCLSVSG